MGNTSPGAKVGLIRVLENQSNEKRVSIRSAVRKETHSTICSAVISSSSTQQLACSLDGLSTPRLSSAELVEAKQCFLISMYEKQQVCKLILPGCRKIGLHPFLLSYNPLIHSMHASSVCSLCILQVSFKFSDDWTLFKANLQNCLEMAGLHHNASVRQGWNAGDKS